MEFLATIVAKRAYHIIAISYAVKNICYLNSIVSEEKVSIVYYGINTIPYQQAQRSKAIELRSLWVLMTMNYYSELLLGLSHKNL